LLEEWRLLFSRSSLFLWLMGQLRHLTTISDTDSAAKMDMFTDGDYNDELDSFLESMPDNFSAKMTTLFDDRKGNVASNDDSDVLADEVMVAEETARVSKFAEASKKVKADLIGWQQFLSSRGKTDKMKTVSEVLHEREQRLKGKEIVKKTLDREVKIINVTDRETIKSLASLVLGSNV
jgi:hypothetical protein